MTTQKEKIEGRRYKTLYKILRRLEPVSAERSVHEHKIEHNSKK